MTEKWVSVREEDNRIEVGVLDRESERELGVCQGATQTGEARVPFFASHMTQYQLTSVGH